MDYASFTLSMDKAKEIIDEYDNESDSEFAEQIKKWASFDVSGIPFDTSFVPLRNKLIKAFKDALLDNSGRINYDLDLKMGIVLYECLSPKDGFDLIVANDDDVWRYISVCVMPDITFLRYPNKESDLQLIKDIIPNYWNRKPKEEGEQESGRLKRKRFYSHTRRIWLKTLWWYVHLGWQGDAQKTYDVLKNNGTNIISHFIERPGRGYRVSLFRDMMLSYSKLPIQKDEIFRAAAKLNLARCMSVEPELSAGGTAVYSCNLFEEVYRKKYGEDKDR